MMEMSRMIEAEWLREKLYCITIPEEYKKLFSDLIKNAPSYSGSQGKWIPIRRDKTHYDYYCSECGHKIPYRKEKVCPNCGADMRCKEGGRKDD